MARCTRSRWTRSAATSTIRSSRYEGTARSITITPDLPGGDYQWRAQADIGAGLSVWTPVWTFTITPPTTTKPALVSPANYAKLDTTTPDFEWEAVAGGVSYQIQIATNGNFKTPVQDVTRDPGVLTYSADPLADGGKYYWRVRAINAEGVAGAWSAKWQFTLNQLVKPVLLAPVSGTQNDRHRARSELVSGHGRGELRNPARHGS